MKADWTFPSKLSHIEAALPPWQRKNLGTSVQFGCNQASPLFDPPYHFTDFDDGKERATKTCSQTQLVLLQQNWQSGYYHPPFYKNVSFRRFSWAGILLEQQNAHCYLYCSSNYGLRWSSAHSHTVKIHVPESLPSRLRKRTVGAVLGMSCPATEAHTPGALRRFGTDHWSWSGPLTVNVSSKILSSSMNQNLILMNVPDLAFLLFQNCVLFCSSENELWLPVANYWVSHMIT